MVRTVGDHRIVALVRGVEMAQYPAPRAGEAAPRVAVVAAAMAVMIAIANPELALPLAVEYRTVASSSLSHS
jgi:hypothetical protein